MRRGRLLDVALVLVIMVLVVALAGCAPSGGGSSGPSTGATSEARPDPAQADPAQADPARPVIEPVSARQWKAMKAAGMARPECPITRRSQLRTIRINFVDFAGEVQRGQLVVNRDVAASVVRIFSALFAERFPIRRMRPMEEYGGDANASLADDNTSAYNCRTANQINAPYLKSPHANGRAIDINPVENPWKDLRCKCWFPSKTNRARVEGPGKILRGGVAWTAFRDEGWIWQNIDVADYMHFDTGYPSKRFRPQPSR